MGARKKTDFEESLKCNQGTYAQYIRRLTELATSMFEWKNLPDTVDERYIEMQLFYNGSVVYFNDDVMGDLCLSCIPSGRMDVYGNPITRVAYSRYNNYNKRLTEKDSVIVWNNYIRTNSVLDVKMFAGRLYNLDRIVDVNANAQKTPVLVQATPQQRLSLLNVYKEYDGNSPVIYGDKNLDINGLKCISTNAPYVADKIYELKIQIWNEALTYLGISNINTQKKERLITDEVTRNQGGVVASRYSRLESRRKGVEKINKMFGTNIEVNNRDDFNIIKDEEIVEGVENNE